MPLSSVFPRPAADDADDVVWTLQTAAVQWQRGLRADAIVWVRKAADTAIQAGHGQRAQELRGHAARLAEYLWSDPEEMEQAAALERSDEADAEAIEIEELDGFEPTPAAPPLGPPPVELAYFGDEDVESDPDVLPRDLDLRSDAASSNADSFMSISPESDGVYVSVSPESDAPRDSFESIGPEPDEDDYDSVAPESDDGYASIAPESDGGYGSVAPESDGGYASVAPESDDGYASVAPESDDGYASVSPEADSAAPSDRPTHPRVTPRAPAPALAHAGSIEARRHPTMPSPAVTPPPDPNQPHLPSESPVAISIPNSRSNPSASVTTSSSPTGRAPADPKLLAGDFPSLRPRAAPPPPSAPRPEPESATLASAPRLDGLQLDSVEGLADLPEEAQIELVRVAKLHSLSAGEQLMLDGGAALITRGGVDVTLTFSDVSAARIGKGMVVPARGSLDVSPLRLIANEGDTRIATWTEQQVAEATGSCPWVVDDLRLAADRYQAYAGAGLGPLGARLDDALRAAVYEKLEVRALLPGDVVASKGKPLTGLFVVAVGELSVSSAPSGVIGAGEFVFPGSVIGAEPSPEDVVAGPSGGLVLFASRSVAHEMMMSVPPLLEILAS